MACTSTWSRWPLRWCGPWGLQAGCSRGSGPARVGLAMGGSFPVAAVPDAPDRVVRRQQARDSPETLGGPFCLLHFPAVAAKPWHPLAHSRVSLVSVTMQRPSPPGSSRGTASCQDTGRAGVGPSLTASSSLDCKDPVFT